MDMKDLVLSIPFWVAMVFACAVKLKASPRLTVIGSVVTIVVAVSSALLFTLPVLDMLDLSGEMYTAAAAALVALSAEHLSRQILDVNMMDLIKTWRGK